MEMTDLDQWQSSWVWCCLPWQPCVDQWQLLYQPHLHHDKHSTHCQSQHNALLLVLQSTQHRCSTTCRQSTRSTGFSHKHCCLNSEWLHKSLQCQVLVDFQTSKPTFESNSHIQIVRYRYCLWQQQTYNSVSVCHILYTFTAQFSTLQQYIQPSVPAGLFAGVDRFIGVAGIFSGRYTFFQKTAKAQNTLQHFLGASANVCRCPWIQHVSMSRQTTEFMSIRTIAMTLHHTATLNNQYSINCNSAPTGHLSGLHQVPLCLSVCLSVSLCILNDEVKRRRPLTHDNKLKLGMSNASLTAVLRRRHCVWRLTLVFPSVTTLYSRHNIVLSSVYQTPIPVPVEGRRARGWYRVHFTCHVHNGILMYWDLSVSQFHNSSTSTCTSRHHWTQPRSVYHKHTHAQLVESSILWLVAIATLG